MDTFFKQSFKEIGNNLRGKQWRINNKKPFLRQREVEVIKEIIENVSPKEILQWGASFNTRYFSTLIDKSAKWLVLEHHEKKYRVFQDACTNDAVTFRLVKPTREPFTDKYTEGNFDELREYIEVVGTVKKFDLIFVEGGARNDCLIRAKRVLKDNGIIILLDANRTRYRKNLGLFPFGQIFVDYRKDEGGLWLGSVKKPIHEVLDVRKHQKRWALAKNSVSHVLSI